MENTRQEIARIYGNRLRVRVCGVCVQDDKILLLNHRGIGPNDTFWCPPGGGVQYGETTKNALCREFSEETGLEIEVGHLLFVNESMNLPLHALELFFKVSIVGGCLRLGSDPEMTATHQIIQDACWMGFEEIKKYAPYEVHSMFEHYNSLDEIDKLKGYFKMCDRQ